MEGESCARPPWGVAGREKDSYRGVGGVGGGDALTLYVIRNTDDGWRVTRDVRRMTGDGCGAGMASPDMVKRVADLTRA